MRAWVGVVLGRVTFWEVLVLHHPVLIFGPRGLRGAPVTEPGLGEQNFELKIHRFDP